MSKRTVISLILALSVYPLAAFCLWQIPIDFGSMSGFDRFMYLLVSVFLFGFCWSCPFWDERT